MTLSLAAGVTSASPGVNVVVTFRTAFPAGYTNYDAVYHITGVTAAVLGGLVVSEVSRTNGSITYNIKSSGVLLAVGATVTVDAVPRT